MLTPRALPVAISVAALCGCGTSSSPSFVPTQVNPHPYACPSGDAAVPAGDASAPGAIHGHAGDVIHFDGTNFDVNGGTWVYFGDVLSPSVICPTSTQCTAV